MRCKYPDKDLSQRLDSTVCRYKGKPYFIRYYGPHQLSLYKLDSNRKGDADGVIRSNDPDFDISTIPMGYFQADDNSVAYAYRRPQRLYKQGVSADAIAYSSIRGEKIISSCFSKHFENMVLGNYPALDNVMKSFKNIRDYDKETAISREVALKLNSRLRLITVFYKGEDVGWLQEGTETVIVPTSEKGYFISRYLSQFNWKVQ